MKKNLTFRHLFHLPRTSLWELNAIGSATKILFPPPHPEAYLMQIHLSTASPLNIVQPLGKSNVLQMVEIAV